MFKNLSLIFVSCLSLSATTQAGKVYEVLDEYCEEQFKAKAIEKVLTTLKQQQLPLPYEQENNQEYADHFKKRDI